MNIKCMYLLFLSMLSCSPDEKTIKNNLITLEVENVILDFEKSKLGVGSKSMVQLMHNQFGVTKEQNPFKLIKPSTEVDESDLILKFAFGSELIFQGKKALLVHYNIAIKDVLVVYDKALLLREESNVMKIVPTSYWSIELAAPAISLDELHDRERIPTRK